MKRYEATFLLKTIFCVVAIALFLLLIWVATTFQLLTIPVLIFIAAFWFLGLEMQILPWLLERWAVRRASRSGSKASSIWFIDTEAEKRREFEQRSKATEDNPTVR